MIHTFKNNSCSGLYRTYGKTILNIPGTHVKHGAVTVRIDVPDEIFADVVSYLRKNHPAVVIDDGMTGEVVVTEPVITTKTTDAPAPETLTNSENTGGDDIGGAEKSEDTEEVKPGNADASENTGSTEPAAANTTEPKATEIAPKPPETVKAEPAKVAPAPATGPAPKIEEKQQRRGRPPTGRGR